jgi:adhesin transport system membrane fusion protein
VIEPHIKDARTFASELKGGSPVRSSVLLLSVVAFLVTAVFWAAATEIDTVTRGDGRVVPSGEVQIVQPSEPGVIADIHVADGDLVEAGDPLVTLDGTQIAGELAQIQTRAEVFRTRIARLKAEIAQVDFTPVGEGGEFSPQYQSEYALFTARRTALNDEIRVLEMQAGQRQQEVREAEARVATAQDALALIEDELALIAPLVEATVEPRTTLIGLEGRRTEALGRLSEAQSAVLRAQSAMAEINDRMTSAMSSFMAGAVEELVKTEA